MARSSFRSMVHRARSLAFGHVEDEDVDAKRTRREFEQQRLRRARASARSIAPFFIAALAYATYLNFFAKPNRKPGTRVLHWSYLFHHETVPLFVVAALAAALDTCPSLVTPRILDCANVLVSSVYAWKLSVVPDMLYVHHKHWLIAARILQASVFGNKRLTILLNVAVFSADVVYMSLRPEVTAPAPPRWMLNRDIVVLFLMIVAIWGWDRLQWAEAKVVVQAQKSDHASALVQQVLQCMCDAVPQLDANLCLAKPCPSLAALLLRGGPIAQGTPFADLLVPEDVEHLHSCLARSPHATSQEDLSPAGDGDPEALEPAVGAPPFAGLCHVHLRGASCVQLPVSVFYSCAPDADGQPTFLLGIREDREEGSSPELDQVAAAAAERPAGAAWPVLPALPETTMAGAEEVGSWRAVSDSSGGEGEAEPMPVWVDATSDGLNVLCCSPGFALLGGARGVCSHLAEWLEASEVEDLRRLLAAAQSGTCKRVLLCPPAGGRYSCTARPGPPQAVMPQEAQADMAAVPPPSCLTFELIDVSMNRRRDPHMRRYHEDLRHLSSEVTSRRDMLKVAFAVRLDGRMRTRSPVGSSDTLKELLQQHRNLRDWLDSPPDLLGRLIAASRSGDHGRLVEGFQPQEIGSFTFKRSGGARGPAAHFIATVIYLGSAQERQPGTWVIIGLKKVQWLQRPGGAPAETQVQPQVLGAPTSVSL